MKYQAVRKKDLLYWMKLSVCLKLNALKPEAPTGGVLLKKVFLKNFTKFTGKRLRWSLFFNKVADVRPAALLKKWLWHRFSVSFAKFCFCQAQILQMSDTLQSNLNLNFPIN